MATEKRLISVDDFIEDIKTEITNLAMEGLKGTPRPREELYAIIDRINEQPTVDAVEVVHGDWVDEYPYVRCSVCNAEWINCITDNEPKLFYYCPNCGAKMDGGNEDGLHCT